VRCEHLLRELANATVSRRRLFDDDAIAVLDLQLDVRGFFRDLENLEEPSASAILAGNGRLMATGGGRNSCGPGTKVPSVACMTA